jgi:trans-aconitate 2-methyltransferase
MATTSQPTTSTPPTPQSKDWSATQYLKFSNERTRPVHDLIAQVAPYLSSKPNPRIYDLGCGPGNSTSALLSAFPGARITGVDASADMLAKARATLPEVPFIQADLSTFSPGEAEGEGEERIDLLFSNAVFHWLRTPSRLQTLTTLFSRLPPGGILAFQMPDNYTQPSHAQMRRVAAQPSQPWSPFFSSTAIGELADKERPDLDPIEPLADYYNALSPLGNVDMWHTTYAHVVSDAAAVVEWVKGSGLQPFLQRIGEEGARGAFLREYEGSLKEGYPVMRDEKVILKYPRLFVVAVRT